MLFLERIRERRASGVGKLGKEVFFEIFVGKIRREMGVNCTEATVRRINSNAMGERINQGNLILLCSLSRNLESSSSRRERRGGEELEERMVSGKKLGEEVCSLKFSLEEHY